MRKTEETVEKYAYFVEYDGVFTHKFRSRAITETDEKPALKETLPGIPRYFFGNLPKTGRWPTFGIKYCLDQLLFLKSFFVGIFRGGRCRGFMGGIVPISLFRCSVRVGMLPLEGCCHYNRCMSPLSGLDKSYPVLIVGGGIVGAGIFRDLSLHRVGCLLIDRGDFSSQTSGASSKILHGGIRYLENMDFGLVREASREKRHWLGRAPHLCRESPFHLPVFRDSLRPLWKVRAGLALYDLLSPGSRFGHRLVGAEEALRAIPGLRREGLRGAGIYCDAEVDDVKLALEVVYDSLVEESSEAINYIELVDLKRDSGGYRAFLRDTLTGLEREVKASNVVFATGPFTDRLLQKLKTFAWRPRLLPSQGCHLWIEKNALPLRHPVLLTPRDGRVIFAVPKSDKVLVGTTETVPRGDFFDVRVSEGEIDYLLGNIREFFPDCSIGRGEVAGTFAGIRPLVKGDSEDRHSTDRQHRIFRPHDNIYVVIGGKYTTFRIMGREVSRELCLKHGIPYNSDLSLRPLRRRSVVGTVPERPLSADHIRSILKSEKVRTLEDMIKRRLGIPGRNFWRESVPFDDFFTPLMPELRERLDPDSLDLSRF